MRGVELFELPPLRNPLRSPAPATVTEPASAEAFREPETTHGSLRKLGPTPQPLAAYHLHKMFPTKGGTLASGITVSRGRVAFGEGLSWSGGAYGTTLHVLAVP